MRNNNFIESAVTVAARTDVLNWCSGGAEFPMRPQAQYYSHNPRPRDSPPAAAAHRRRKPRRAPTTTMRLRHHIYLIGLMGAGKTTVGRRLAKLLDCDFIDTDQALEARTGVSVSYIFELEGEAGFRAREAQLLAEISRGDGDGDGDRGRGRDGDGDHDRGRDNHAGRHPGAVIATGGGIILRADNRRVMRACGRVIYLRAALHLLQARLQNCDSRPLLSAPDPAAKIAQLLAERGPLYAAEADHIIDVTGAPAARVANQIHDLLRDELEHRQH